MSAVSKESAHDSSKIDLKAVHCGVLEYEDGLAMMSQARDQVLADVERGQPPQQRIFFVEHPPTITLGRRGTQDDILASTGELSARGVVVHRTDRGGQATFHGPGQLVVYPVVSLEELGMSVRAFVAALGQSAVRVASDHGVAVYYNECTPGVWTEDGRKLASVGLRTVHGVTTHGLAMNIDTDLEGFSLIVPCGAPQTQLCNLSTLAGRKIDVGEVAMQFAAHLCAALRTGGFENQCGVS